MDCRSSDRVRQVHMLVLFLLLYLSPLLIDRDEIGRFTNILEGIVRRSLSLE